MLMNIAYRRAMSNFRKPIVPLVFPVSTRYVARVFRAESRRSVLRPPPHIRPMDGRDMNAPMRAIGVPEAVGYVWARQGLGVSLISTDPMPSLQSLSNRVRDEMDSRT